jgi:hypothetical protein
MLFVVQKFKSETKEDDLRRGEAGVKQCPCSGNLTARRVLSLFCRRSSRLISSGESKAL